MAKVGKIENDPGVYLFYCPACGCSHVFRVPPWEFNGDYDKPTVKGSVLVNADLEKAAPGSIKCHLFVRDGKIEYLGDCTHGLAGKTVEMEDF